MVKAMEAGHPVRRIAVVGFLALALFWSWIPWRVILFLCLAIAVLSREPHDSKEKGRVRRGDSLTAETFAIWVWALATIGLGIFGYAFGSGMTEHDGGLTWGEIFENWVAAAIFGAAVATAVLSFAYLLGSFQGHKLSRILLALLALVIALAIFGDHQAGPTLSEPASADVQVFPN